MILSVTVKPRFPDQPKGQPPYEVIILASEGPEGPAWNVTIITDDAEGHIPAQVMKSALSLLSYNIKGLPL